MKIDKTTVRHYVLVLEPDEVRQAVLEFANRRARLEDAVPSDAGADGRCTLHVNLHSHREVVVCDGPVGLTLSVLKET
jgi:hypothetical protein